MRKQLPERLYAAWEWIDSAGEWPLALTTGREYAKAAHANAVQHGQTDVTEVDIIEAIEWERSQWAARFHGAESPVTPGSPEHMEKCQRRLVELANLAPAAASAMDLWRLLLDMADTAAGSSVSEEEWIGICGNIYELLRAEQAQNASESKPNTKTKAP